MSTTRSPEPPGRSLREFVEGLQIGGPIGHLNLTLVPLRGNGRAGLDYILSAEAIEAGTLVVTEIGESGSVSELLAHNRAEQMVLLLDGEELVGAKQNRILNTSILLAARAKTKIPVSCVEQGRWRHTSGQFGSGSYSPGSLRRRKSVDVTRSLRERGEARSDQAAVWKSVQQSLSLASTTSLTGAMYEIIEKRRESLDAYAENLRYAKNACGVIAGINGRFVAADVFDNPRTLERVWRRLVTGYAFDALGQPGGGSPAFTMKAAEVLLEHVGELDCQPYPSVGHGEDWRFEVEDVVGQAMIAEETCVHLCFFPNADALERPDTPKPQMPPPSKRRRRWFRRRRNDDAAD